MRLLDWDTLPLSCFFPSQVPEMPWKEKTEHIDVFFSEYIIYGIFVTWCFVITLLRTIYVFIFIIYLLLSVHLEIGGIILSYEETMWSYGKKHLELSSTTSK